MEMSTIEAWGTPPSPISQAGDTEVVSMTIPRGNEMRSLGWVGTTLFSLLLLGVPGKAAARPYLPNEMPLPEGDPTSDDQPSPTPKGSASKTMARQLPLAGESSLWLTRGDRQSRFIWLSYVRAWIRITLY
jgi:hypothetical protein